MPDSTHLMEVVAKILAISVLIDQEQREAEMIEFMNAVTHINHDIRPEVILSNKKIRQWFEDNKASISESLASDDSQKFKSDLLEQITDTKLRRTLLASIFSVSVCDYELHDEECEFLKLATHIWGTGPLNGADLDLIVS